MADSSNSDEDEFPRWVMVIWDSLSYAVSYLWGLGLFVRGFLIMQTSASVAGSGWDKADRELDYQCLWDIQDGDAVPTDVIDRKGTVIQQCRQRSEWKVGIAYKTFLPLEALAVVDFELKQLFAHWSVYIRECESSMEYPYKAYGMNFESSLGEDLVMEAIWSTPDRGWQRSMLESEVPQVATHGNVEHTLYFCIEEFEVTARNYPGRDPLHAIARVLTKTNGNLYGILAMNCQDFSEYLINSLVQSGWDDAERLHDVWDPVAWVSDTKPVKASPICNPLQDHMTGEDGPSKTGALRMISLPKPQRIRRLKGGWIAARELFWFGVFLYCFFKAMFGDKLVKFYLVILVVTFISSFQIRHIEHFMWHYVIGFLMAAGMNLLERNVDFFSIDLIWTVGCLMALFLIRMGKHQPRVEATIRILSFMLDGVFGLSAREHFEVLIRDLDSILEALIG